jgi:hypothetical protein
MALSDSLQGLISSGLDLVTSSKRIADSDISASEKIKNQLYANADKIQGLINSILQKGGIVTNTELDALDEEIRLGKLKILEAEAKSSNRKYAIYVISGLAVIGAIWYFTYKKI